MKVLHLSDLHFRIQYPMADSGYNSIFNNITPLEKQLDLLINKINLTEIEVIVITGDITEDGNPSDYKAAKQLLLNKFGNIPILITLGNHDVKLNFYQGWLNITSEDYYNTINLIGDMVFIGLDNSHTEYPNGIIEDSQCKWLEQVLLKYHGYTKILFFHHHLLEEQLDLPPAKYQQCFIDIIEQSNISLIIGGHTHHNYSGYFEKKPYHTCKSLSFYGIVENNILWFKEDTGATIYTITKGDILREDITLFPSHKTLTCIPLN